MISDKGAPESRPSFEPLEIMGVFWSIFGLVVLLATLFVESTPRVPAVRGVLTNLLAGLLLLAVGVFSMARGRSRRRKRELRR